MDLPWTTTTAYADANADAGNLRMLNSLFEVGRAKDGKDFLRRMREPPGHARLQPAGRRQQGRGRLRRHQHRPERHRRAPRPLQHELGRFELGGGSAANGVFKIVASDWVPGEGFTRIGGLGANSSSYMHIVAFDGDRSPDSRTLLTYSRSADPTSAHDNDQLELFSNDQWVTGRFCEHEIQASPEFSVVRLGSKGLIGPE